jgi:hypothetical protein
MSKPLITDEELAYLDELHAAGSLVPWNMEACPVDNLETYSINSSAGIVCMEQEGEPGDFDDVSRAKIEADFVLATEARNALPRLIAEIRRLRGDTPIVVGRH